MPIDTPDIAVERTRLGGPTRLALLVSLAVNALFIGGLFSAVVRHNAQPFGQAGGPAQKSLGAYVSTLPVERKDAIWQRSTDKRRLMNASRRDVRQAREDALVALTAEPFDKERFLTAETRLIEAERTARLGQRDVLVEIAGSMTPEERRAYLRWRGPPRPSPGEQGEQQLPK